MSTKEELTDLIKNPEIPRRVGILEFEGIDGKDVYNPSKPFKYDGKICITARVEPRDDEFDSKVAFFEERDGIWHKDDNLPILSNLQDPFVTKIDGDYIFGGVEISSEGKYKTIFLDENFDKIVEVKKMKCVRPFDLPSGEIGVFIRPTIEQNLIYGKGKIHYTTINSLYDLDNLDLMKTNLIDILPKNTWGGVNDVCLLDKKKKELGVLGHIAYCCGDSKYYYPIIFKFNYETEEYSPQKIITTRNDFPINGAKRCPELFNVVYPGGLNISRNYTEVYVGISDAYAGKVITPNPFK
jgi:hypothetical protein